MLKQIANKGAKVAFITDWHHEQAINLIGMDSTNWLVCYNDIADYFGDAKPHNSRLAIVSRNTPIKRVPFLLKLCLESRVPCDVFTDKPLDENHTVGQSSAELGCGIAYYNVPHNELMLRLSEYCALLHGCKHEASGLVFTEAAVRGLPSIHCSPAGHEKLSPIGGADYYAEELNKVFLANAFRLALDTPRQGVAKIAQTKFSPKAFVQRIKSLR